MLLFIWIWFYASVIWHLTRFPPLIASTKRGETDLYSILNYNWVEIQIQPFYACTASFLSHLAVPAFTRSRTGSVPVRNWCFYPAPQDIIIGVMQTKDLNISFSGGRRLWMKISLVSFISPIELSFGSATPARKPSAWCRWWWVFSQYAIFVRKVSPQPNYILGCSPPRHSLLLLTQMFFRTYVVCACHRSHITQTQCYSRSHSV